MKKFFVVAIVSVIGFCAFAVDNSPFISPRGGVQSYTETNFEITTKFGDYYRTPSIKYQHRFNDQGQEVESIEYTAMDQLVSRVEYGYTSDGRLSSQTCYDEKGKLFWKIVTTFDSTGNKTEDSEYDGKNALTGKTLYKNEGDNPIEETYYNANGELIWKNTYKYTDMNQLEESWSYFATGRLDIRKTYRYDLNGNIVEIVSYNEFNDMISREIFIYNEDGTVNEYAVYGMDNKRRTRVFYKYDENKNCVKATTYNIAQKFGTTVNEMVDQSDFEYQYK